MKMANKKHDCENCIHKVVCALWEIQNELCDSECSYYQPTLASQNEPLTIEELLKMDGQPVWLETADGAWGLVDADNKLVRLHRGGTIDIYKLDGILYRRPPERQEGGGGR